MKLGPSTVQLVEESRDAKWGKHRDICRAIEGLEAVEFMRRYGLSLHSVPDALAGRMAKAGWCSVEYDSNKPSWRVGGHGFERYVEEREVEAALNGDAP